MSAERVAALLDKFIEELDEPTYLKQTALILGDNLFSLTPAVTGVSRSNWFASYNQPSQETTDRSTSTFQNRGLVLGEDKLQSGVHTIWITNNLDWIQGLDMGASGQAPNGFTRQAVKNTIQHFKTKIFPKRFKKKR